jgi:hypothetical protein
MEEDSDGPAGEGEKGESQTKSGTTVDGSLRRFESQLDGFHDLLEEEKLAIFISLRGRQKIDKGGKGEGLRRADLIDHNLESLRGGQSSLCDVERVREVSMEREGGEDLWQHKLEELAQCESAQGPGCC